MNILKFELKKSLYSSTARLGVEVSNDKNKENVNASEKLYTSKRKNMFSE